MFNQHTKPCRFSIGNIACDLFKNPVKSRPIEWFTRKNLQRPVYFWKLPDGLGTKFL